ncbi:MAG: hypothetical protein A4E71_00525 [Smithella sp. PtaU1.Bin162]|nr:MAG: hypothetical protein A4E71_00525 [Smithella sp. PtaU1.Bin162]
MADTLKIAQDVFARIQKEFPHLSMRIHNDQPVELSMDIPKQEGLNFDIYLNLQNNDELHLMAGNFFWLEWFPCTKGEKVEEYLAAVLGLISGKYRICEHYRGKKAVRAELQVQGKDGKWKTIGAWSKLSLPFPCRKHYQILQNVS